MAIETALEDRTVRNHKTPYSAPSCIPAMSIQSTYREAIIRQHAQSGFDETLITTFSLTGMRYGEASA